MDRTIDIDNTHISPKLTSRIMPNFTYIRPDSYIVASKVDAQK
ncbi:MAG: hypothetical protein U1D68_11610 [Arthrobacter sp.]|nr:hypothetical protein [Arthrobacter sp.]MDZ4353144.1 hypothetical protein [Arthrobacter sp.]